MIVNIKTYLHIFYTNSSASVAVNGQKEGTICEKT